MLRSKKKKKKIVVSLISDSSSSSEEEKNKKEISLPKSEPRIIPSKPNQIKSLVLIFLAWKVLRSKIYKM